jgi:hypothetical protein
MTRPRIERPARFLVDNGILFEINRQVLHPLGLELDLEIQEDGAVCEVVLSDNRGIPQPMYFTPEEFEEGREKYQAYMQEHGRRNIQKRRKIGMVIQTGPNLPPHIHWKYDEEGE